MKITKILIVILCSSVFNVFALGVHIGEIVTFRDKTPVCTDSLHLGQLFEHLSNDKIDEANALFGDPKRPDLKHGSCLRIPEGYPMKIEKIISGSENTPEDESLKMLVLSDPTDAEKHTPYLYAPSWSVEHILK